MRFLQGPPCIPKHTEVNCSAYTIHQRGPRGNLEEQNPQLFSFLKCFEAKERKGPQPTGTASGREPQTPLPPGGQSLSRRTRSRWTREGRTRSRRTRSRRTHSACLPPAEKGPTPRRIQRGRARGSRTCLRSHVSASEIQGNPLRPQNAASRKQRGESMARANRLEDRRTALWAGRGLGTPRSPLLSPLGSPGSLLPLQFP